MNYLDKIAEARKALLQAIEIGEKLGYGIGYLNNALSDIQRAAEDVGHHEQFCCLAVSHQVREQQAGATLRAGTQIHKWQFKAGILCRHHIITMGQHSSAYAHRQAVDGRHHRFGVTSQGP